MKRCTATKGQGDKDVGQQPRNGCDDRLMAKI